MEKHQAQLKKLCRVCGRRIGRTSHAVSGIHRKSKAPYAALLLQVFNIDVANDDPTVHPSEFCSACFSTVAYHSKVSLTEGRSASLLNQPFTWKAHDTYKMGCAVCLKSGRGGKQNVKRVKGGKRISASAPAPVKVETPDASPEKTIAAARPRTSSRQQMSLSYVIVYMDKHQALLKKLCRVCGRRIGRTSHAVSGIHRKSKAPYAALLLQVFNIDVANDDPTVHPSEFCSACFSTVAYHSKVSLTEGRSASLLNQPFTWKAHDTYKMGCAVCLKFGSRGKRGIIKRARGGKRVSASAPAPVKVETPDASPQKAIAAARTRTSKPRHIRWNYVIPE